MSCYRKEVPVPNPDDTLHPKYHLFEAYLNSDKDEDVTFAHFLRTHNTTVIPVRPYTRLRGNTVALAVEMTSPFTDGYYAQWLTMYHAWGREVHLPEASRLAPPRLYWFATALILEEQFWTDDVKVKHWFCMSGNGRSKVATLIGLVTAWRSYVKRFISGEVLYVPPIITERNANPLTEKQKKVFDRVVQGFVALRASDGGECHIRMRGEAGTGKSRLLDEFVHHASLPLDSDQRPAGFDCVHVLLVSPTGVLSDVYRRKWLNAGTIVVDTFDGAFDTLDRYELTAYTLSNYDAWLVDECDFLSPLQWKRLTFISRQCPHVFQLLAGDPGQFRPMEDDGGEAAGQYWAHVLELTEQLRFDSMSPFGRACRRLRTQWASAQDIEVLCGRRVLCDGMPTAATLRAFHEMHPDGISLAVTKESVSQLNSLAVEGLMLQEDFLGHARVDDKGTTKLIPLYRSCRVLVTYNVNKAEGVVNGAFGVLLFFNGAFAEVRLDSGVIAILPKIAYERADGSFYTAFPLDIGYAVTLAKMQGQTLERAAAILPDASVPAGGYVAITRLRKVDNLFWYGKPTRNFFCPGGHSQVEVP